jgi:integrase
MEARDRMSYARNEPPGEDVKTVQELLRHANSSVTMNIYAQAVTDIKRNAQSKVARLVFDSRKDQGE